MPRVEEGKYYAISRTSLEKRDSPSANSRAEFPLLFVVFQSINMLPFVLD
jgi:hypothetical protein